VKNVIFFLLLLPILFVFAVCASVALVDDHWIFDTMALPLLPSFVVALVAGLIALALRRWRLAIAAAVAAAASYAIAAHWTEPPPPPKADAARFSLLLFNTYWRNAEYADVAKRVAAIDADVVVLLEITPHASQKLRPLSALYPNRFECWQTPGCDILVLSRFPIKEPHIDFVGSIQRSPIAWFEASPTGCGMNIFATHLTRPFPFAPVTSQERQADDLAKALRGWPGPKLLVGDFNAPPWGHIVKTVENQADLHVSLGAGGTWHAALPPPMRVPIDHVMASQGLAFASRKVLSLPGSDHAAVLTEIAIDDRSKCW
jgi:endonuclease/exonuclease/phosphatase (EEP) superfamily protein YafD